MQVVCSVNRVHATNRVGFLKTKNSRASVAVKSNMAFQSWDFDSDVSKSVPRLWLHVDENQQQIPTSLSNLLFFYRMKLLLVPSEEHI